MVAPMSTLFFKATLTELLIVAPSVFGLSLLAVLK